LFFLRFQLWIQFPIIHIQQSFVFYLYQRHWFRIWNQLFFFFIKLKKLMILLIWFLILLIRRQHLILYHLIHLIRFHNQRLIWLQRIYLLSCWLQLRLSIKWVFIRQHLKCLLRRLRQFKLRLRLGLSFRFWLIQLRQLWWRF